MHRAVSVYKLLIIDEIGCLPLGHEPANDAGKAARLNIVAPGTGGFDHLLLTRSGIYHCSRRMGRTLRRHHPEPGECRFNRLKNQMSYSPQRRTITLTEQ